MKHQGEQPVEQRDSEVDAEQGDGPEHAGVEDLEPESSGNLWNDWIWERFSNIDNVVKKSEVFDSLKKIKN